MRVLLGLYFITYSFWLIPNNYYIIYNKSLNKLFYEFKSTINNKINRIILILVSFFVLILTSNIVGLFPYIFTSTSHLVLNLTLALPLWVSFLIFG